MDITGDVEKQQGIPQKADKTGKLSKAKWCLLGCLIITFVLVVCSLFIPSRINDTVRWLADNDFASNLRAIGKQEEIRDDSLVEMVIENVGINKVTNQPVVLLKQKGGDTYLPISIGVNEVNAIAVILGKVEVPRPLTPDLLCSIIDKMGGRVDYIVINDLKGGIFYANIAISTGWMKMKIDSRPSDAIAIALRVRAPIYVNKAVMDKAGVSPGNKTEKHDTVHLNKDSSA